METKKELSSLELLWYYLSNITTLGGAFLLKVIIKKAIVETQ